MDRDLAGLLTKLLVMGAFVWALLSKQRRISVLLAVGITVWLVASGLWIYATTDMTMRELFELILSLFAAGSS